MTIIQRSMLLVLLFLLASAVVITVSFVLIVVCVIVAMELLPVLKRIDIKIYHFLVFLSLLSCFSYVMGTVIGKPLLAVMGWLKGLSEGTYGQPFYAERFAFLWNKRNKIKWHYAPFKDIIVRLQELSKSLELNRQAVARSNEMKEQWLSGVSHDLKTPLSYVKGYLELMANPDIAMSEEERNEAIRLIKRKVDDIEGLIHAFQIGQRTIALKTRGELVRFLRDLTLDAANNPRAARYHFCFEANVTACEYLFDPKLLKRVMQNLLINAVIHNPPETEISVRLEVRDRILIQVTDNGAGMPPAVAESLFRSGFRGRTDAPEGEGIGLAVVKALVEEHQGKIEVQSAPNLGTTVTMALPLRASE